MRVAVLSDIHSNLVALDAVLAHAGSVDAVWHLGDVVGYGPDPDGVVARLAGLEAVGVRGNHDAAALGGPEIDWFNPDARAAAEWTRDRMDGTTRAWLDGLPTKRELGAVTLVHGSPRDPLREYVVSMGVALANLRALTTTYGLHGHTHVPIAFIDAGTDLDVIEPRRRRPARPRRTHDAAQSGQRRAAPRRRPAGLVPRAGYRDATTVTWHRVAYDIGRVQAAIRAAGLPRRLADRLAIGA